MAVIILIFILLATIIIYTLYLLRGKKYEYWKRRGVPYLKPSLFFGSTGRAIILQTTIPDIIQKLYREYEGYLYVGFFNINTPAVVVRDVELAKEVLIKQFSNFPNNWIKAEIEVDPVIGYNPFVLRGDQWKKTRNQLTPQFTSAKMKAMLPALEEVNKSMIEYIKRKIKNNGSNTIEINELAARITGDNVMSCAYGLDGRSFREENPYAFQIGDSFTTKNKLTKIKQSLALFFPLFRRMLKITFLGSPISKLFNNIILDTIEHRENNNISRKDYLDFIKELKYTCSDVPNDYLVAHAFTFFLDGFETSYLTLAYAIFELAKDEVIQNKTREAIESVLNDHDGQLTYEVLNQIEYVDRVIFETLRMHSIIRFISRVCTREFNFPSPTGSDAEKEVRIEKGTQVFFSVAGIHSDPNYYPEPHIFNPDNFGAEAVGSRPKCAFLGFGEGPKICLGRKFALTQIKLALISVLLSFNLRVNGKTSLPLEQQKVHLFNYPKNDIWIDFEKR